MKILIVDDSSSIRNILKCSLNSLGYSDVIEANDGLDAQLVLDSNQDVELMLVDWKMPNMSGYELLQIVKNSTTFKHIRIIMVTTATGKEDVMKAIKAGASNYLIKPFTKDVLAEKIKVTIK